MGTGQGGGGHEPLAVNPWLEVDPDVQLDQGQGDEA